MPDIKTEQDIRADQEVITIQQAAPGYVDKARAITVKDELTSKGANDIVLALKKMIKRLDDRRKFFNKPLKDHAKAIDNDFADRMAPLKEAYEILRGKLETYVVEQSRIQRAKDEKIRIENEKKAEAASGFLAEDVKPPEVAKTNTQVRSSFGKSYLVKNWTFKLVNIEKVPRAYMVLDEKKVRNMIKAQTVVFNGVNRCDLKIPGIEIYQSEKIAMRG